MTVPAFTSMRLLPTRMIIAIVAILGLAIIGSSLFTYATLQNLRSSFLSNRGHETAAALEGQARGQGKRNNPIFWQSLLQSQYANYAESVAFMALVDQTGNVLAYAGANNQNAQMAAASPGIYIFEEPLPRPRVQHSEASSNVVGWRIRLGLYIAGTKFIQRQAFLQLAVSVLAVLALVVLSASLIRALNRFLEIKARESAEAQLRSLGIMAASLAHEIRNPLGSIKGLSQLVQEDLPEGHAVQLRLQTVVGEAERLERLVTDLLDFAHTKEPRISEFELVDLLSGIKTMLGPRLEASGVDLRLNIENNSLKIRSDPAGLQQVVLNVLMNAIDATPERGAIHLSARHLDRQKSVIIQVDDSGKGLGGISPEELFQPFFTTKARGTGLGLAISRQITESLGGTLTLENLPGAGARCSIRIPAG